MSHDKPKFNIITNIYLVFTAAVIILVPLEYMFIQSKREQVATSKWHMAIYAVAILIGLLTYAGKRCASSEFSYVAGLQYVTTYMDTGWVYSAFCLILFALVLMFVTSILISVYGDLTGQHQMTPYRYYKLVYAFYRHRTHQ